MRPGKRGHFERTGVRILMHEGVDERARWGGGGVLTESCMAVVRGIGDPRIPKMAGRTTSGFLQRGTSHCVHQSQSARDVLGEPHVQ